MSSNLSSNKRRRLLLDVSLEPSLSIDIWKVIYEYMDEEDFHAMQLTKKEHYQGIKLFVKEFVDSYEYKSSLPQKVPMNFTEINPPSLVPLWYQDLDFDANGGSIPVRKMKALYPTILYKHILFQKQPLSFNQTFGDSFIQKECKGTVISMTQENMNVLSHGFGVSNRLLVPGQRYRVTATFEYGQSNQHSRFGITRPMTHSDANYRYGSIPPENIHFPYTPTRKDVMSAHLPLAWQQNSIVNAVLFSEHSGFSDVEITSGNGGFFNTEFYPAHHTWRTNVVQRKCLCCKNDKHIVEAYFELDLTDASNGKLNLLKLDYDPFTQSYHIHTHLLADGLVGEYVWTATIGVSGKSTTKIHIHEWSGVDVPLHSICDLDSVCSDSATVGCNQAYERSCT